MTLHVNCELIVPLGSSCTTFHQWGPEERLTTGGPNRGSEEECGRWCCLQGIAMGKDNGRQVAYSLLVEGEGGLRGRTSGA